MEPNDPVELELRRDLQDLQRKAMAMQNVFPASNKTELMLDKFESDWNKRLDNDQLRDGLKHSMADIRQGKEPDLSFTIPEPPKRVVTARDRLEQLRSGETGRPRDDRDLER